MPSVPPEPERKEPTISPPAVWATMANDVREYDQDNVKRGKGDVDTLLVFAGLFSAVLASFLVAVYPSLQPSPMDVMNYTLERIANQTASYNFTDGRMIATNPSSPPPPFQAAAEDIRVNVLWFASLIISLITSSFGMLVKQWMDDFLAVDIPEPQARLRLRHYRAPQIEAWMVYEIVACLPLLLHLSLGLFFIGLCYFTSAIHASIGYTTFPLVIGWTFCLFFTTALPIFFPRCPYKISLFKPMIAQLHRTLSYPADLLRQVVSPLQRQLLFLQLDNEIRDIMPIQAVVDLSTLYRRARLWLRALCNTVRRAFTSLLSKAFSLIISALKDIPDEDKVAKDSAADLKIFSEVDAMRANDEILRLVVTEELPRIRPSVKDAVSFAIEVLAHRAPTVAESERLILEWPFRDPFPLDLVRPHAQESISKVLYKSTEHRWTSHERSLDYTPLWQRGVFLDVEQNTTLCALAMILSDIANSTRVKLPPNIVDFLRHHLGGSARSALCRDVLSLGIWHCADIESCWKTAARLITTLAKLVAPLNLKWQDRLNCLESILCLEIEISPDPSILHPRLTWNYPTSDEEFGAWKDWNIPDDIPNTSMVAALEYLFILLSAEFKQAEDFEKSSREAPVTDRWQETPEVLCCTLRHFMKYSAWDLTHSGLQAFVDLVPMKSEELMGIMVDSLVSTDLDDPRIRSSASDNPLHRWSGSTCYAILQRFHIRVKPSSTTPEESFAILSSVMERKFALLNQADMDTDLVHYLSLCHVATFLFLVIYAQSVKPGLGMELFSSIAVTLSNKTQGRGTEISNDKVARQLAYDCLRIMRYEQEYKGGYDQWLAVFSQGRKTSFPDTFVKVLGRFFPDSKDLGSVYWLHRLRELRDRTSSVQPPVDTPSDQRASEVQSTEHDENTAVTVVDEPDLTFSIRPSIVQDLPDPSTRVENGLEGGEGRIKVAVDERDSERVLGGAARELIESEAQSGEVEEGMPEIDVL